MIEGLQRQLAGFSFQESSNVHHSSNLYPSVSSQQQKPTSAPSQSFYGSNASAPYSSTAQHLVPPPQHVQPQSTNPIAGYERTNQVGYQSTTNPTAGYQSTNSAGYHQTGPPSQAPYYPPPPGLNQAAPPPTYYSAPAGLNQATPPPSYYSAPAGLNQATPPPSYYSAPPTSSNNLNYRQSPQLPLPSQSHPGWQASQTAYYNGPSVPMNPQAPLPPPPPQHAPPGHYYQPPPNNYYR